MKILNLNSPSPALVGVNIDQVDLGLFEPIRDIYILLLKGLNSWSDPYKASGVLNKFGTSELIKQVVHLCGYALSEPTAVQVKDLLAASRLAKTLFLSDDVRESGGAEWFERLSRTADYMAEGKGIWEKIEDVVSNSVKDDLERYDGCGDDVLTVEPMLADIGKSGGGKEKLPVVLRKQVNSEFPNRYLAGLGLPSNRQLIHVKSHELRVRISESYSGASISDSGKVVRPFQTEIMSLPGRWVSTSGLYSVGCQKECYRLLAKSEFQQRYPDIEPLSYREHVGHKDRSRRNGGYNGVLVNWGKKEVVLTGPPLSAGGCLITHTITMKLDGYV